MRRAGAVIEELTGRTPSAEDLGDSASPLDQAGLLVGAEIARSGLAAGRELARQLAPDLGEPRVRIDDDRLDIARTTLESVRDGSEEQYLRLLDDAGALVQALTGDHPSPTAMRGADRRRTLVWLLAAAEIPWAGHRAAYDLAADILGLPRLPESGDAVKLVERLGNAARRDPDRARTTLGMFSDERLRQIGVETDRVIREAITRPPAGRSPRERAPREWRTLDGAEIARAGREAGMDLARALMTPPKKVRFADEPTVIEPENEAELRHDTTEFESEPPPKTETVTETDETASPTAMPIEDVLEQTQVGVVNGRPLAVWLPGARMPDPPAAAKILSRLDDVLPKGMVLVFGDMRGGRLMAGGREITVEAMASAIAGRAPDLRPFLAISGGARLAEPLSRAMDEPVLATPYNAEFDPETGEVISRRSGGPVKGADPKEEWFRLYTPGDTQGDPLIMALYGRAPGGGDRDAEPEPDPDPGSSSTSPERRDGRSAPPPPPLPTPPEPQPPQQAPAMTPIEANPAIRSIGVPRAGLPQQPELLRAVRRQLDQAGVKYTEKEFSLLTQRLLANYPYLLSAGDDNGTSGLMVPIGDGELLFTLDPTDPHTLGNPAGSTLVPSTLPKVEGEHHAVDTINSVFATGAHTQTESGQTGATRGAISLSFGIGATPGVLQVVKIGAGISGVANQSNRSTTHIADAEGGHVEDNRAEATLVAYTANWSFKVRKNPSQSWMNTRVHRLTDPTDERLLLWITGHYLEDPDGDQVTATGDAVKRTKLPKFYFASGLTNLPRLFDEIVAALRAKGLKLPIGSLTRGELLQKLWNLNMHLDAAVNTDRGYRFTLHNKYGRQVATVALKSRRLSATRVGATSDKSHIENVRTAIDGSSGGHSLTNSSTLTFPSVEFDLVPSPPGLPDLGVGLAGSLAYTSSNVEGLSTGRVGLNVVVPRDTSHTAGYEMWFSHQATVSVRGKANTRAPRTTSAVTGRALVRMPEAAAYEYGFPVDRKALKNPPPQGGEVPFQRDAIRGLGTRPGDAATKPVPQYVADGKGIGMGLPMVADSTVERIQRLLETELRRTGFLPADSEDPFGEYAWYGHGNKTDSRIDNLELFEKMVSSRGLDSYYDQIRQDGMTFTLRKRRGGMGVDLDVDSAKITIKAKANAAHPPRFLRSTSQFHTVNLAMGMDSAGMSVSHTRKLALGFKVKALYLELKNALMGIEWQRIVGASDAVNYLNNRPELLEYPGIVDEFELTSDYEIKVEYQHSGAQGRIRKGRRDPAPWSVKNQVALAYLLPIGTEKGPTTTGPTPAKVLDQGVVYFLDTTGAQNAIQALGHLADPAGMASSMRSTYAGTIEMRSHLKEILQGEYTTDRPFESGLFRDKFGAMDISGAMGPTTFTGATADKFVLGIIRLFLSESRVTQQSSTGWTWEQLDVAAGGDIGPATLVGESDASRHWQHNRSTTMGATGGKEPIQLDFNRVYIFETTVDFTARSRLEKHSKLWPTGTPKSHTEHMRPRTMTFLLPEPEALAQYADGHLAISDRQLKDAMLRWNTGRLKLGGDLAAKILMRWRNDVRVLPKDARIRRGKLARTMARLHRTGATPILEQQVRERFNAAFGEDLRDPYDSYLRPRMPADVVTYASGEGPALTDARLEEVLAQWREGTTWLSGDTVAQVLMRWHDEVPELSPETRGARSAAIGALAEVHQEGGAPIESLAIRDRFNAAFGKSLGNPRRPYHLVELPEYLTRKDPAGRFLGHSGLYEAEYQGKRSLYQIVRERVEQVAPGMLAAGAEIWDGKGRRIGRMQGSVDALQSIFARGRELAMWEDFLGEDGFSLYLANPVGWLLTDVIEVNLKDVLTSEPEVHDYKWNTGLENYLHGYIGTAKSKSRDGSQAWMPAKLSAGNAKASGPLDLKTAVGHHRGMTRAESAVSEQTVYDWANHYAVRYRHQMTVRVRRLNMSGRPLNNLLLKGFNKWTRHSATSDITVPGTLNLQIPHALAEAGNLRGPEQLRNLLPLPKMPGNAAFIGVVMDGLYPAARKLLDGLLGPGWAQSALGTKKGDPNLRSSLSLPTLLSRSHLTNHVRETIGGSRYTLPEGMIVGGDSSERANLWVQGEVYDAQVLMRMSDGGTGTGRYIKHQSGTTTNNSTDLARGVGEYAINGSDVINPQPTQPEGAPPQRPDHGYTFTDSGSRVTSANQNSAGTENYRREGHAKELGSLLLLRLRGQWWVEAQKTRHHLFRSPKKVGAPVRTDPVSGDVYMEMFEAQYQELLAQIAQNRRQAEDALRDRADPTVWNRLVTAPTFDLPSLLVDAAAEHYTAGRAHHPIVNHIREQGGANGPLVLTFGQSARTLEYRTMLRWAVKTMRADLYAARELDPGIRTPASIQRYEELLTRDDARLISGLGRPVQDEITSIINEVNRVHDLRPDNPLGAPAELPPEAALLATDPVHLARDIAAELRAHVRVDVAQPDGTTRSQWVDPAGRIYAFDPTTFSDAALTADQASRAGLWTDETRRLAVAHGFGPLDLARLYRTSWRHQQTFEQAVRVAIEERRQALAEVHEALPGLFGRAMEATAAWQAIVTRLEAEHTALTRQAAEEQRALDDAGNRWNDLDDERVRLTLDLNPDPAEIARIRGEMRSLDGARLRRQRVLEEHNASLEALTRRLGEVRTQATSAENLLGELVATRPGGDATAGPRWTDQTVQTAGERLTAWESLLDQRRVDLAYRPRSAPTAQQAIDELHRTLGAAGSGAVSLVVTQDAAGVGGRFTVVSHGGRIRWFESESRLPVEPPRDAQRLYSLDVGGDGVLLDPPPELRGPASDRSFGPVRHLALADIAHHLDHGLVQPDAREAAARSGSHLPRFVTEFENRIAYQNERLVALTAAPGPRIVSLAAAMRSDRLADAHVYRNDHGQHGVGPGRLNLPGWTRLGALASFAPVYWVTRGARTEGVTARDVRRTALGDAVRFLSGDVGQTMEQRVRRTFGEHADRDVERVDRLPDDLPPGTWVWFAGPSRSGAAVATADGYRVLLTGVSGTREVTARQALRELSGRPYTIVIARPRATPAPGVRQRDAGGRQAVRGTGTSHGVAPPVRTRRANVDDPLPADPHVYVSEDGQHRVTAAGMTQGSWTDLGAVAEYTLASWLLRGGPERGLTDDVVVREELDRAIAFLTENFALDEHEETVRTLLAGATGRAVELTDELPAGLPEGTLVYYSGPDQIDGAVVLSGSRYRSLKPDGTTQVSPDQSGDVPSGPGHNYLIVRPATATVTKTAPPPAKATSSRATTVAEAERLAARTERREFDPARLQATLDARHLSPLTVPGDGNCFYHSLIEIAGAYLERHISGLSMRGNRLRAVGALRNWLADRLEADFAVAAQGLPSRYAGFFHVVEGGPSIAAQQQALVHQIRTMGEWDDEAGDIVAHLAAYELGLRITLIQDRYVTTVGPDGPAHLSFIRMPGHYLGTRSTRTDAPRIPWRTFRPVPPTSAAVAHEQYDRQIGWAKRRYANVREDLESLTSRLDPDIVRDLQRQVRERLAARDRELARHRAETAAHLQPQHRLDANVSAVGDLERMVREYQAQLGEPAPSVPGSSSGQGVRARTRISDYLFNEVNSRLARFGGRWLLGRVDRGQIREALADLPQGGPTDPAGLATDLVYQIVFGRVPRMRGGERPASVRFQDPFAPGSSGTGAYDEAAGRTFGAGPKVFAAADRIHARFHEWASEHTVVPGKGKSPVRPADAAPRMEALLSRLDLGDAGALASGRPIEPTVRLMLAYRELGLPESDAPLFLKALKAGLMSDLLPEDANPAHLPMADLRRIADAVGIGVHRPVGDQGITAVALERRLGEVLPPYDGTALDCVLRLEAVRRELYGGPAVPRDDFTVGDRRPERALAAALGGDWRPLHGPPESIAPLVKRLGPGAMAFLLVSMQNGPGHAFALRNEGGHLLWVETQAGLGSRVYPVEDGAPVPGGDVYFILVDATGRAVVPDSLPDAPYVVDALRLAPEVLGFAAQGREHEMKHVVHGHGLQAFHGSEEVLVFNRATGVVVETDTMHLWVAGRGRSARYYATKRAARMSGRGKVKRKSVNIVEVVARPERVQRTGEERFYDPAVVRAGIRDAQRRLNNAVRLRDGEAGPGFRGTSLRELFGDDPNYEFGPNADDLSILLPPGWDDSVYTHISEGTYLTSTLTFLQAVERFAEAGDIRNYFHAGLRFGDDVVLTYLDDVLDQRVGRFAGPATEHVPGVADVRASMTLMNTHTFAAARVFVRGDEHLAKNLVHGALRTSFAAVRESMPPDVQSFLEDHDGEIRTKLRADLRERLARAIRTYERHPRMHRRWREFGPEPLSLFEYPLRNQSMTLGDYVDNMLLPSGQPRYYVDQDDAMNVRTNMRRLDRGLVVSEIRDIGPERQSLRRAEETAEEFARLARLSHEQAERVAHNNATAEGQEYNRTLLQAVDAVSAYRPNADNLATDVRDLLDSVARHVPDLVRDPIFRENVTSNLQADAVVALSDFIGLADGESARAVRHAVKAIRDVLPQNEGGLRREADGLIRRLREYRPPRRRSYPAPRSSSGVRYRWQDRAEDPFARPGPLAPALWPAGPDDVLVPVADPGRLVAAPVTTEQWFDRRADAPVVPVATERSEPKVGFTTTANPEEDRWDADIRFNAQRIQVTDEQWVRYQVAVLPVKPMPGIAWEDVEALEGRLNEALDAYWNRGYELPVGKDQTHLAVKLVHAPEYARAIELRPGTTKNGPEFELDTRHWGLEDYIYALVHEVLHYFGLRDEYPDARSAQRSRATSSAIKADGLMAGGAFDPSQPVPARYLRLIETVVDATAVLLDHPLPRAAIEPDHTGLPVEAMDEARSADPAAETIVGPPDDAPERPGPAAPETRAVAVPLLAASPRSRVAQAYAQARTEFRLPGTYRFTPSHAAATHELRRLAGAEQDPNAHPDWVALATRVNRGWQPNAVTDAVSAVLPADLPGLLSAARLALDVHGPGFTLGQLRNVRRLADAMRSDPATLSDVLQRPGREPGDEVGIADVRELIHSFGGYGPLEYPTADDVRMVAALVAEAFGSAPLTVGGLRTAWETAAGVSRSEAAAVLGEAGLAVAQLGLSFAVIGADAAAAHRTELEERLGRLRALADAPWRPNQRARVDRLRDAVRGVDERIAEIHAAAVHSLEDQVRAELAGSPQDAAEALRQRLESRAPDAGPVAVHELLAIRSEAARLAEPDQTPDPEAPAEPGTEAAPRPVVRRLPGRIRYAAEENARLGVDRSLPWGEWGHVFRVGDVRLGEDRPLAAWIVELLPMDLRRPVEDGVVATFTRLGSQEAGRRLASPTGLRVPTPTGPVTVRLVLGPLTGEHGARYRRPQEVQSVQIGARPSQALDHPQIVTPSTFTDVNDNRSIAPESTGDGPISIATGWNILPTVGVMPTVTGSGSRGFGAYEGAVIQTVQQIWRNQYAYFEVPANHDDPANGSRLSVTFPGEAGEETVIRPADVLLAFAEDDSPLEEGAPPAFGPERALPDGATAAMAEDFHRVLWRVTTIGESLTVNRGPEAVALRIALRFPDADAGFISSVTDLFTESALFRVHKDVLGHGYLSDEFRVNQNTEDWAAFRLRGRMTAFRQVDTAEGYVQQDARHLFWSGESSSMSGGVASDLTVTASPPTFTVRGTPVQIGPTGGAKASGSVTRSLAASMGAGDWRYGAYPSSRRIYRLTMALEVDVRSSRAAAARPARFAMTGYVEVPEREADRFERELNDVLSGVALDRVRGDGRLILPADGPHLTDRMPPLGILKGRSRGPSVPDMLGGFEKVVPRAMELVDQAFGDPRLTSIAPRLTARQRHRLERAMNQRFSVTTALPYTSQLISHRMSFTRLYQAPGGRVRLKVRVRSQQGEDWTGGRLEWGRIDHYPIYYDDLGATEQVADQLGYRGGGHLRLGPLHSVLRRLNFPAQFHYARAHSAALTARFGVWSSLGFVYEGPLRTFLFGTRYHVDVELTFEPEAASAGTLAGLAAGVARQAADLVTGTPPQGLPTRTVRRHDDWSGLIRYMIAEGLSPLTGGHSLTRTPVPDLGRALRRRPPVAPVTFQDLWGWAAGRPELLRPDDQPLEVLGIEELWQVAGELLEAAGIPPETYNDTLDVTVNEDQIVARMLWGGPTVQASGIGHGGSVGDRHAVVSLRGKVLRLRPQVGEVGMYETDITDSEPAVIFTGRRSTSHVLSGSADLAGEFEDGGPYGSWTLRNVTETNIDSNEVLSGRWLTQENREYRPHRGTMLWDVTVTSWSANALGSWSLRHDRVQVLVVGGLLLLRPAPQPRIERPPAVPARMPLERLPLTNTSDRLEWPQPNDASDGLNPVLAMVRGVLHAVDEQLLYRQWRIVNGTPRTVRSGVPTTLQSLLQNGALLGHRDTLLGPGLILHLARSLSGAGKQFTLVLRAEPLEDYDYGDTRARDFALYRLNTQRQVGRHSTTSAHTLGANAGTARIPATGRAVSGTYLEGTAEGDHYEQTTIARGKIFRTRDVLTILGDTHAYTGALRITATVYRGYNASKPLQVLTLGLADRGLALFIDPNTPVPVAVTDFVDIVERAQFPASMLPGRPPNLAPVADRVRRLNAAPTPEEVLTDAGLTPFAVGRADILRRGVVPAGIDAFALRVLFDRSIAVFSGTAVGGDVPAVVRSLMTATGMPWEAYAALLSRHQFITSFHLTLDDGHAFPPLVREDGPATDARGETFIQTRLYNPKPLRWIDSRLTSETLHMAENDLPDAAGTTFGGSLDGGPALAPPRGDPVVPVEPSGSLGQSHDHGLTAGERLVRPIAFRRHAYYLRVSAGVLGGLRVSAANERRDVRYGAGESLLWYGMDDSVEVLLDPETALAKRMLFGSEGIPGLDGRRYLPHVPAVAPQRGSPAAAEELNRLRAALALPRYGDWYILAGHYDPAARQVVQNAMRDEATGDPSFVVERHDVAGFADLLTGFDDLGDRPIILIMGGMDVRFASAVARRIGHDLLISSDDIRQDHAVQAVRDDAPGSWILVPRDGSEPIVYGADLDEVLTRQIVPELRGARLDDEPGTMYPDPAVIWPAHRVAAVEAQDDLAQDPPSPEPEIVPVSPAESSVADVEPVVESREPVPVELIAAEAQDDSVQGDLVQDPPPESEPLPVSSAESSALGAEPVVESRDPASAEPVAADERVQDSGIVASGDDEPEHLPAPVSRPASPPRQVSGAERPGWHAHIVLYEVRDADGRLHGLASYTERDVERRAPVLSQPEPPASSTAWHKGTGGAPAPVPTPAGAKTLHWFSDGAAGQVTAAARDGEPPHVPDGETALDHAERESAHTYPDPVGDETGLTSVTPRPATSSEPGGVLVELPALPVQGETFGRVLERALEPRGPERDGSTTESPGSYRRLLDGLTEEDLPASAPLVDGTTPLEFEAFQRAGITLSAGDQAQAILGQKVSVASLGLDLDRVQLFRLAMETKATASAENWGRLAEALDAAVRRLGVRIVLSEPGEAEDHRPVVPSPEPRNAPEPLRPEPSTPAASVQVEGSDSGALQRPAGPAPVYRVRDERWWPLRADHSNPDRPGEDAFVLTPNESGPPTVERGTRSGIRQTVSYDLKVEPQDWSFRLRLHVKPARGATQEDLTMSTDKAAAAADKDISEPGHVLPGTDARLGLLVEFTDDPGDAFAVVEVVPGVPGPNDRMNQLRWFAGAPRHAFAHELVHFLGVRDTHGSPRALLRPVDPPAAARPDDLMGDASAEGGSYVLLEDHLAQIVEAAAPYLPPRPDLFRADDQSPHHATEGPDPEIDLPPEIDHALLVAEDEGSIVETEAGIVVYRWLDAGPDVIFEAGGLHPRMPGNLRDLQAHIASSGHTQFVSTTRDPNYRHKNRRYRYMIRPSDSGIDVAGTLAARGIPYSFSWEQEVAFTGTIPLEDIVEVLDAETGWVIPNPGHRRRG
ncbi:scabin-related ADP-ribosyltransferase [Actinoallomurus acaciae]|uniref:OTU domain-containing protein n=1 Tax=Actinoallomurus acaciae TaxID=502577 RepID=A0ABV5Y7U7_9ACTN